MGLKTLYQKTKSLEAVLFNKSDFNGFQAIYGSSMWVGVCENSFKKLSYSIVWGGVAHPKMYGKVAHWMWSAQIKLIF